MKDNEITINVTNSQGTYYGYNLGKGYGGGYAGKNILEVYETIRELLKELKIKGLTLILKSEVEDSSYQRIIKLKDLNILRDKLSESFNETNIDLHLYSSNLKNH